MKPKLFRRIVWKEFYSVLTFIFLNINDGICRPPINNVISGYENNLQNDSRTFESYSTKLKAMSLDLNKKEMDKRSANYVLYGEFVHQNDSEILSKKRRFVHPFVYSLENKTTFAEEIPKKRFADRYIVVRNKSKLESDLTGGLSEKSDVSFIFPYRKPRGDDDTGGSLSAVREDSQDDVKRDVIISDFEQRKANNSIVFTQMSNLRTSLHQSEVGTFIHKDLRKPKNRNHSRKRRQTSPPDLQNDAPKRRRRKRKHRHKLLLKARDSNRNHLSYPGESKGHRDRFILKSDDPGYVITSANVVKKDWCRTVPLQQTVSEPHCESVVVMNHFCYGQCNSFFIPFSGQKGNAFQSCAFCKPHRPKWANVTLNCPGRSPPKIEKTILVVDSCRCITEVLQ